MQSSEPAMALVAAVDAAVPAWVEAHVERVMIAWTGQPPSAAVRSAAVEAGLRARADVGDRLRALLAADVDAQRTNPLAVIRGAAAYPTEVLRAAGVPPVVREPFDERTFPDDIYGLSPAAWRDLGAEVHDAGIVWGAWKAATVLARRRQEGKIA